MQLNELTSKIGIVGCGPAGIVMAIALARQGIASTIFEKDSHPEVAPRFNPDRSYAIDITGHGLKALRYIDACDVMDEQLIPFKGIRIGLDKFEEPWPDQGWTGSRGDILRALATLVDREYASFITMKFQTEVTDVDVHSGVVTTVAQDSANQTHQFDLVVGGDGGGSTVREALVEQISAFTTTYKEIPNYATMLELDRVGDALDKQYLYILSQKPFCIAGAINGDSGPDSARWFCVVGANRDVSYANAVEARHFFEKKAPTMLEYVSEAALEDFASRKSYHIGRMLRCSQLYGGKAVLLGDAGAPFSPIGQGINAAMESAVVLDMCIEGNQPEQLYQAVERYNAKWKPEADAVTWISERFVFDNGPQLVRLFLTARFGINAFSNAKKIEYSYSQVKKQAEKYGPVWAW